MRLLYACENLKANTIPPDLSFRHFRLGGSITPDLPYNSKTRRCYRKIDLFTSILFFLFLLNQLCNADLLQCVRFFLSQNRKTLIQF